MIFRIAVTAFAASVILAQSALAQTDTAQPKLTLISNVNIFDGKNEQLLENRHVLVKDNLIETISDEGLAIIQTDNVTRIDGGGRTLMPGLIDAHVHLSITEPAAVLRDQQDWMYWGAVSGKEAEKMLGLNEETIRGALGPHAVQKFFAVQNGARNQMRLLNDHERRRDLQEHAELILSVGGGFGLRPPNS